MANIEGVPANIIPDAIAEVITESRGVSVPGGIRTAVIIGEGARTERLVTNALGRGKDGLDPTYTTSNGSDGRHFETTFSPLVANRSTVFRNGIPLNGVEQSFNSTSGSFSSSFDYRLDISTGHIELQTASLVDQGGKFYTSYLLNVGNGTIAGLSLLDPDAPTETWTIKCSSVKRDGYGNPIPGYAKFIAIGSVSGNILDGYGNQVFWQSNGVSTNNTILQFSISEGASAFSNGDSFTIQVKGGALSKGETLSVTYISVADLNDPEFFSDLDLLVVKHGTPSLTNRISLGAQLAFANGPPGVWACQAAPSIPRRVSYIVEQKSTGGTTLDDLSFPLPLNVIPDVNSSVHFFITDPTTKLEKQILFNKVAFYDPATTASPVTFTSQVSGHSFSYTVVLESSITETAEDGYVLSTGPKTATLSSASITFHSSDVGKTVRILSSYLDTGNYTITSVNSGVATISNGVSSFTTSPLANIAFEVIDNTAQSAQILITQDVALSAGQSLRVTVVDQRDATFFDAGWTTALASLEAIDVDIVVPLPSQTISAIFTEAKIHCETLSQPANKKERVLFIGAINGLTPDNVIGNTPAAVEDIGILEGIQGDTITEILSGNTEDLTNYSVSNAYGNSFRVVYFYPDQIVVQIGADRVLLDGFFLAPAAAGYLSGVTNIAIPLTNKVLAGFSILRNKLYRPIILQNLAAAGVCTLQPAIGGGTVVWGLTTSQSGFPEEQELSIVFIRDRIAKSMRASFRAFVGTAETPSLIGTLMARANGLLQSFISQGLITAFTNLKVVRDSVDPRQWNITVAVQPTYPVNWIYIRVGIGLL